MAYKFKNNTKTAALMQFVGKVFWQPISYTDLYVDCFLYDVPLMWRRSLRCEPRDLSPVDEWLITSAPAGAVVSVPLAYDVALDCGCSSWWCDADDAASNCGLQCRSSIFSACVSMLPLSAKNRQLILPRLRALFWHETIVSCENFVRHQWIWVKCLPMLRVRAWWLWQRCRQSIVVNSSTIGCYNDVAVSDCRSPICRHRSSGRLVVSATPSLASASACRQ